MRSIFWTFSDKKALQVNRVKQYYVLFFLYLFRLAMMHPGFPLPESSICFCDIFDFPAEIHRFHFQYFSLEQHGRVVEKEKDAKDDFEHD